MERTDRMDEHHPEQDTALLWSSFPAESSPPPALRGVESMAVASQEIGVNNHIPVFLDRTFRMVEEVPDDIVCWSAAGDSFIIKQVLVFEEILPSYFNHKKFMSFVRQLNFYGFKKTGRTRISSRSKSTNRDTYGDGAAAAASTESESWEEFRHPQFRRGRRDLLAGIQRQKDGGRLKRKRADAHKSDIMSSLVADVGTVNGELKAVKGKLDSIMTLLFNMGSAKNHAVPSDPVPQLQKKVTGEDAAAAAGEGGGGGGVRFGGGAQGGKNAVPFTTAEPPAATARGGYGQWVVGGSSGGVGIRGGGHEPYAYGVVLDNRPTPHLPVDHQQGHLLHSRLSQDLAAAQRHPVEPNQPLYHVVQPQPLPPLGAAVAARASESAPIGLSRHQLPPLQLSPSRVSESVTSSPSERKQGGEGKGNPSPEPAPPNRGGGGGGGGVGRTSPSPASSAVADPHDAQPQHYREAASNAVAPTRVGGRRGAAVSQMQQGLSDGTMSMLQVLSQSAACAAETEKEKRANSINSTSSTGSVHSNGTQSSFEYD